jgi:hypothetical protein
MSKRKWKKNRVAFPFFATNFKISVRFGQDFLKSNYNFGSTNDSLQKIK